MHYLLTLLLGPVLVVQGYRVKKHTPRLPEPPGPREGIAGEGRTIRLLILGDSAGAGVGAKHQNDALSGRLVHHLSKTYCVHWHLIAETGATTKSTLETISKLHREPFDVVVTSLGVNDVTSGMRLSHWRHQQLMLRELLRDQFDAKAIICTCLPPMHRFPALAQPLRWYIGRRAAEFDKDLQRQLVNEGNSHYLNLNVPGDLELMASDGFHPGPQVYKAWGKAAADLIKQIV